MKARIYGIRNCDTIHDYKKAGVPPGKLKEWARKAGWEKLANTRGPTWRKIPASAGRSPKRAPGC